MVLMDRNYTFTQAKSLDLRKKTFFVILGTTKTEHYKQLQKKDNFDLKCRKSSWILRFFLPPS